MPFNPAGSDIALKQDPDTGKYDFDWDLTGPNAGNPKYDGRETHRTASLVVAHRGKWAADTTGQRGSVLYTIKNDRASTTSDISNAVRDALAKAVADGAILPDPQVDASRVGPGSYEVDIATTTPDGNTTGQKLSF